MSQHSKPQESPASEALLNRIAGAWVSQAMTLEPGDLLFTGTPEGVAMGMKPPRWLKAGDRVRVEIGGLGAIENEIRAEA